jgi:hypothetical protein
MMNALSLGIDDHDELRSVSDMTAVMNGAQSDGMTAVMTIIMADIPTITTRRSISIEHERARRGRWSMRARPVSRLISPLLAAHIKAGRAMTREMSVRSIIVIRPKSRD